MSKVITRYAPSPTGIPHIGNIRTALFNFLFAKSEKGEFILRIEDTDQKRSKKKHIKEIENSLEILGIHWDQRYIQSERLKIYQKHLGILKSKKVAYNDKGAWRFKIDSQESKINWQDSVHKNVEFPTNVIEDFIIIKSDGFPTYHFASVIDDHEMQISHVIRGDEWISSTPKHLLIYDAFSWQPPKFCHVPLILGTDKKKLSKREGAMSIDEYIKEGYLPEALVNQLALLGWSPKGDRELFSISDLIKEFSLVRLNKNNPIFNKDKLSWFNGQWIRKLTEVKLIEKLNSFYPGLNSRVTKNVAVLAQDRINLLSDYEKIAGFFYKDPELAKIPPVSMSRATISNVTDALRASLNWTSSEIKAVIGNTASSEKVDRIELITDIRNIVSGSNITPPLFESLEKLGQEKTIKRLKSYLQLYS